MYGEAKSVHFNEMKERSWLLGEYTVDELYEYQNLGVFKNYCGSFSTNVDENIEKATTKAGMMFSANVDRLRLIRSSTLNFGSKFACRLDCLGLSYFLSTKVVLKNSNDASVGF